MGPEKRQELAELKQSFNAMANEAIKTAKDAIKTAKEDKNKDEVNKKKAILKDVKIWKWAMKSAQDVDEAKSIQSSLRYTIRPTDLDDKDKLVPGKNVFNHLYNRLNSAIGDDFTSLNRILPQEGFEDIKL